MKYSNIFLIYLFIFLIFINLGIKVFGYWSTLLYLSLVLLTYYVISRSIQKCSSDILNLWYLKSEPIFSDVIKEVVTGDDEMTICLMCNDFACERHDSELAVYLQPWKHLLIDPNVNAKLEHLLEFLLEKYTEAWLDEVSYNKEEIIYQLKSLIRMVASSLLLRIYRKFRLSDFLLSKFPKYLMHHLEMYIYGKRTSKSGRFIEESVLRQYGNLIHPAMISSENDSKYLKSIADLIIYSSFPSKHTRCDVSKTFLNEFISCCLLSPLVDIFTDPDKINLFCISLLYNNDNHREIRYISQALSTNDNHSLVEFLSTFNTFNHGSGPNHLSVKLKAILEDQHLLFLFTQYSKEEYFLNYLQFVMHMNSFFNRIITPYLSEYQLKELHKNLCDIYHSYFVKNSKDYIYFDESISQGFQEIVQSSYTQLLHYRNSRSLYDAYEFVNYKLEYFCHKFFLTDVYLKLICGQRSLSFNLNNGEFSQENDDSKLNQSKQLLENDNILSEKLVQSPKDLSKWKVSIPKVTSQLDPIGRETYCFEIHVIKMEDEGNTGEEYTIKRLISEFYTLESRLKEFHGDELENVNLPTRKLYLRPSRSFLESQRAEFEHFLQQLLTNVYLKRSEMICSFLSCSDWHNNFLENFNLTKMIRNVPSKFAKERGQHLESFLKNFVESSEKSDNRLPNNADEQVLSGDKPKRRRLNSLSQLTISAPSLIPSSIDHTSAHIEYLYDHLLFMLIRLYNLSNFIVQFLLLLRPLVRQTFQHFCDYLMCRKAKRMLRPDKLVELIEYLTQSLDSSNSDRHSFPINLSRNQRSELALKLVTGIIPKWIVLNITDYSKHEEVAFLLFSLFQHRLLNKQLLYLILNVLVAELFPEVLLNTVEHTRS